MVFDLLRFQLDPEIFLSVPRGPGSNFLKPSKYTRHRVTIDLIVLIIKQSLEAK